MVHAMKRPLLVRH